MISFVQDEEPTIPMAEVFELVESFWELDTPLDECNYHAMLIDFNIAGGFERIRITSAVDCERYSAVYVDALTKHYRMTTLIIPGEKDTLRIPLRCTLDPYYPPELGERPLFFLSTRSMLEIAEFLRMDVSLVEQVPEKTVLGMLIYRGPPKVSYLKHHYSGELYVDEFCFK